MTEEIAEVTPTGQDGPGVTFDEHGELKFSEAGLEGFKELLKADVHDEPRPTQEALDETEKEEPDKEEEPETPKRKLKVDGQEIEVTEDELITLAQQGRDYTKKTQQLAEERNAMAPFDALIRQLKTDPALSQHIAKYWQPQPTTETTKPQFDDPIEQLKWETKQEVLADFRKEMQEAMTPLHRQSALNQVRQQVQADPDYKEVHQAIVEMVQSMPPSIQKNMYLQLDQDPASYVEAFQAQKAKLAAAKKGTPPVVEPITGKPVETRRTERAPILETTGTLPSEETIKTQRAKIDKAKAKVLRDGSVDALQSFLETGGFLDHLR